MNLYSGISKIIENPEDLNKYEKMGGYVIENKFDGIWMALYTRENGVVYKSLSRRGLKKETPLNGDKLVPSSVIIGEYVKGIFYVFDILQYKGKIIYKQPFFERRKILEELPIYNDVIKLVPQYKKNFLATYKKLVDEGYEGVVLKKLDTPYTPNERAVDWHKIKKHITMDYIITGYLFSNSASYKGLVSSLKIGLYRNGRVETVGKVPLASEELKHKFSNNPYKYLNKIVEVGGQEVFKTGAMRFPVFIKLRPDLGKEDANKEKMVFESALEELQEGVIILKKAKEIANELKEFLKPVVSKIEIVGSIARRHESVSDIDIVAISKGDVLTFLKENNISILSGKKEAIFFDYKKLPINLWLTSKESFPFTVLHFGAGKGIIDIKRKAIEKGYTLNRYGLFKEGKRVNINSINELFKLLNTTTKFYKIKMLDKATESLSSEEMKRLKDEGQFPRSTEHWWRFRQKEPEEFGAGTFRIVKDSEGNAKIVGKINGKWETQSVMINKNNITEKDIEDYFKE